MEQLSGRVAVVTGAASGIGRALAERFAREGMKVALADIEEGPLADVAKALRDSGAEVIAVPTDVARAEQVQALADRTLEAFGAVHVVCNNAGVAGTPGATWERAPEDWDWILGVNLHGVIHGIRTFVPILLAQGDEGHVVNTASVAGLLSIPGMSDYNVTKHAVVTLSECLHHELQLAGGRVRASVLCPAWVNTRIIESDRLRPGGPRDDAAVPGAEALAERARELISAGMDPAEVASQVVDAIREKRFYILTHPEWRDAVRRRMECIVEGRDPEIGPLF